MKRHFTTALLASLFIAGPALAGQSLTLDGRYEYRTDEASVEMLGTLVCFYPAGSSTKLLPRPKTDKRLAWFCFRNAAESKRLLGIPSHTGHVGCGYSGEARVTIDEYRVYLGEGDDFDTARLQSVIGQSGPKLLSCGGP